MRQIVSYSAHISLIRSSCQKTKSIDNKFGQRRMNVKIKCASCITTQKISGKGFIEHYLHRIAEIDEMGDGASYSDHNRRQVFFHALIISSSEDLRKLVCEAN